MPGPGLTALAERGVAEYLVELARPELAGRLAAAAADLASLGRTELAVDMERLVTLAGEATGSAPGPGDVLASGAGRAATSDGVRVSGAERAATSGGAVTSGAGRAATVLTELLGEELRRTVRDALTGSQLIATRDLAILREDLIDRRYPKRRLLELLAAWVDAEGVVPAGGFVQVVDSAEAVGASSGRSVVEPSSLVPLRTTAARLLAELGEVWGRHAEAGWPGCLPVWDIGREVLAPLLRTHGRVAVLLVDALRADLALQLASALAAALPDRVLQRRWAVVPEPTRTAESLAAMAVGRPVPGGSAAREAKSDPPFAHLGFETAILRRADRDHQAAALRELWAGGPPVSVAVATGVDERLHHTSVELAALLDEAIAGLRRRVLPSLAALPDDVPLVVLADHGFRENPAWGKGPDGRYVHGGTSLEESVIPVFVLVAG